MQNETHIDEVLDAVVKYRLPESRAVTILQDLQVADAETEIRLHQAAAAAVRLHALEAQIRGIHGEFLAQVNTRASEKPASPGLVRPIMLRRILRVAAVLLLVASGWFTFLVASTSGESLYRELYQPFSLNTERGLEPGASNDLLDRFKQGDYPGVIASYETVKDPSNREQFLAAYACQATGDFKRSIPLLRAILDRNRRSGLMLYQDDAEYFLGLALVREKEYKAAAKIFSSIANSPDHTYHHRVNRWLLIRLRLLQ